jgi:hypothetical protein
MNVEMSAEARSVINLPQSSRTLPFAAKWVKAARHVGAKVGGPP